MAGFKDAVSKSSLCSIIKNSYFWYFKTSTFIHDGRSYYSNAFVSSGVKINFDSINIKSITLFNEGKYINQNDIIHLNFNYLGSGNFTSYQIRFRFTALPTKLVINRVLKSLSINLSNAVDIKFKLVYQVVDVYLI